MIATACFVRKITLSYAIIKACKAGKFKYLNVKHGYTFGHDPQKWLAFIILFTARRKPNIHGNERAVVIGVPRANTDYL